MRILVPLFLLLSLSSVYAQETVNSLDLASPAFTVQERALLVATEGVYFSKSIFEKKPSAHSLRKMAQAAVQLYGTTMPILSTLGRQPYPGRSFSIESD